MCANVYTRLYAWPWCANRLNTVFPDVAQTHLTTVKSVLASIMWLQTAPSKMDTWKTHYHSADSERGTSRSLAGLNLTDLDIQAYVDRLVANEQSATLTASGSMNYHASNDQLDLQKDCVRQRN